MMLPSYIRSAWKCHVLYSHRTRQRQHLFKDEHQVHSQHLDILIIDTYHSLTIGIPSNFLCAAWGPGNPAVATVKENIRLTSEDHFQDTRHIAFELGPESGPQYEPGDILTIWPRQDSSAVNKMLSLYGLRPEAVLEVKLVDVQNSSSGNTSLQVACLASKNWLMDRIQGHNEIFPTILTMF